MDDSTRLRVLEPLDGNSLMSPNASSIQKYSQMTPLASSFTHNAFGRTQTPVLEDGNGNSEDLLKWKYEQKEFVFESNSTPSKPNIPSNGIGDIRENRTTVPAGRRRNGQLIGAAPKFSSNLQKMTSKLELIDNTHFTSLPIAPPSNRNEYDNDTNNSDNDCSNDVSNISNTFYPQNKRMYRDIANEIIVHNNQKMRYVSYRYNNYNNDHEERRVPSEIKCEGKHPIVIVEDYILSDSERSINESHKKRKLQRNSDRGVAPKVSVHSLKDKLRGGQEEHIPIKRRYLACKESSGSNLERIPDELIDERGNIKGTISSLVLNTEKLQDKDEYLSLMKSTIDDTLKKCVLCEKVLYEFSSIIQSNNVYKELVCGSCTEKYEVIAKLLEDCEFESSTDGSQDLATFGECTMDSMMASSDIDFLRSTNNTPIESKNNQYNQEPFSATLIETLHSQLKLNEKGDRTDVSSKAINWFMEARKKLRWRWRVSGLLPEFINSRDFTN
ncbi:hypothetical protein RNJ44_03161 [Nakaseomyces bracarensis]|uniref:Uncharacterized protein n=1 Tax=Nakaseomyces bracarensis TaxID=273131 RepID=A0ABR4NZ04_9SACH